MSGPMQTFRVLGLLLSYPREDLIEALDLFEEILEKEGMLTLPRRADVAGVIDMLRTTPLLDQQESYVAVFDQTPKLSLNLFEHVFGESKERGQAMAELHAIYQAEGLEIDGELPDYLPLFCEFLSTRPDEEASEILAEASPALALLADRLSRRPSLYAAVVAALLDLSGASPELGGEDECCVASPDFADLDRSWQEAEVNFGVGDAHDSCSRSATHSTPQRSPIAR